MRRVARCLLVIALTACSVSEEKEVALGRQNSEQINAKLPIVSDPAVAAYIQDAGLALARTTSRAELDWRFFVVNSREVNAFALPGGFIYVNRGLIERATGFDELAGALAHEIGHVVRRHSVKQMEKSSGANVAIGLACTLTQICESGVAQTAIQVGGAALFARYSRQDEAEADSQAVMTLVSAGVDPNGIPSLFERLLEERRRTPMRIEAFFASHPMEEERVRETRRQIDALDPTQLRGLQREMPSYRAFRDRLRTLP